MPTFPQPEPRSFQVEGKMYESRAFAEFAATAAVEQLMRIAEKNLRDAWQVSGQRASVRLTPETLATIAQDARPRRS